MSNDKQKCMYTKSYVYNGFPDKKSNACLKNVVPI